MNFKSTNIIKNVLISAFFGNTTSNKFGSSFVSSFSSNKTSKLGKFLSMHSVSKYGFRGSGMGLTMVHKYKLIR